MSLSALNDRQLRLLEVRDFVEGRTCGSATQSLHELAQQKLVRQSYVAAFENLKRARNALFHLKQQEVSASEAIRFVAQAASLREYLDVLKKQKTPSKRG